MKPLLHIDPQFYIVPILHLLIGLVNKEWCTLIQFLDEFVENVSDEEAILKDRHKELELILSEFCDEFEVLTVNKEVACMEMDNSDEAKEIYKSSDNRIKYLTIKKRNTTMS